MPAKTEKAKALHHLEACFRPLTPTNEPVANVIDGNVQLNVPSPIPDIFPGVAKMLLDRLVKSLWVDFHIKIQLTKTQLSSFGQKMRNTGNTCK